MLYKNHNKVNLLEDPLYKKHKVAFESFLEGKSEVIFKTNDKPRINPTGWKEYSRGQTIPVHVITPNAEGTDNDYWIWTGTAPKIKQNGEKEYDLTPLVIEEELHVRTIEKDKIFFLMCLSKAAINKRIWVQDPDKENRDRVSSLKQTSRINFLIMDELSPVDEFTIKRIAKAFGVGNVDSKSLDKVKLELKATIDVADSSHDKFRNSEAFVKAINEGEEYDTRAQVQEAIDAGRIKYNEVGAYFFYAGEDGEEIKKIMNVDLLVANDKIRRMNALNNYYIVNADKKMELARLLNYSIEDPQFSNYLYTSLKSFAKHHGILGSGSQDELVARITDHYNTHKNSVKYDFSLLAIAGEKKPTE